MLLVWQLNLGATRASAAVSESQDIAAAVAVIGVAVSQNAGAAGYRNPLARWAKDRRRLEKEIRDADEARLRELLDELEPAVPASAQHALAKIAAKLAPVEGVRAQQEFRAAQQQYAKEIARIVAAARQSEIERQQDEDNLLLLLLHAA